ncbi:Na+/H+ antiporter NhaA [Colwellia sp. M166]|uniref:Na+/H+ antiporter NhaA n=1 Tax=Colwellia sp. M166 TaxID=2583805 RepID=UPI00211DE7A1|nr:Na+/H+ antiporter NhaA [Colwellia sp. M166]UUO22809.1 Na+/H+ antiporter NhaA [Colwellia sp. M166]|tara:strand:+ start:11616 stop:12812 length:1197 start_codon:yes stop_codon:yes gene_type:complete
MIIKSINDFLKLEAASGIILMFAAVAAMIIANSPLMTYYDMLLNIPVQVSVGTFEIAKPLLLWINDGLMALFFFLVGLELKREFLEGDLSQPGQVTLPAIGAFGGMLVPALCYVAFNYNDPKAVNGWAIPTATDIAFALGILSIIGSKVPLQLKVFLTSLAIFDDLGAIIVIALFYTDQLSMLSLIFASSVITILFIMNKRGVTNTAPYIFLGIVLWIAVLKSGVHATLAGVVLAFFIPIKGKEGESSPLKSLEHNLHSLVAFIVLPVFAFANAGISFAGIGIEQVMAPVPLGIIVGLVVGKQLGVFGFCFIAIKLGWANLPTNVNWRLLYGVAILCGVGFTMSLFIGSLAFEQDNGAALIYQDRLGIVIGSIISGILGYFVIKGGLDSVEDHDTIEK